MLQFVAYMLKIIFQLEIDDDLDDVTKVIEKRYFSVKIPRNKRDITHVPFFIFLKLYFALLDLKIDPLTSSMTFNHQNSTRKGLFSQNHTKKMYYTSSYFCF